MIRVLIVLCASAIQLVAGAQDGKAEPEGLINEVPQSIDEALDRRDQRVADALQRLREAEHQFKAAREQANQTLVDQLKLLAKQSIASGDLPEARRAWERVLKVDSADADAAAFFAAIGQREIVKQARDGANADKSGVVGRLFIVSGDRGHRIVRVRPGRWEEFLGGAKFTEYKEVKRDNYSVLLMKEDTGTLVRIHATGYYWNSTPEKEKGWAYGGDGKWLQ